MEIEKKIKIIISDYFNADIEHVNKSTTAADIQGWDSMAHTELLLELEQKFNIDFELSDLMGMDTVGDLIEIIQCKL
ncbi:MAG: acyl carrier protein [Campylobacterota bacterium]|nr:acyl carrier protein [Campylobacterota bacterium]